MGKPRVVRDPEIHGGDPIIEGTRWNTHIVLAGWEDKAEILGAYPHITEDQVDAAIAFEHGLQRRLGRFVMRLRCHMAAWLLGVSIDHLESEGLVHWTIRGDD